MFYDGNQGCYYYFDVIAQKYRLHSQVHSDTAQLSSNVSNPGGLQNCQDMPESVSEDSDSDNSEDSGNLIIKEDTEEDTEQNEKEIKGTVVNTVEKLPIECHEKKGTGKEELNTKENDSDDVKEDKTGSKSDECVTPPSTCEVFVYFSSFIKSCT